MRIFDFLQIIILFFIHFLNSNIFIVNANTFSKNSFLLKLIAMFSKIMYENFKHFWNSSLTFILYYLYLTYSVISYFLTGGGPNCCGWTVWRNWFWFDPDVIIEELGFCVIVIIEIYFCCWFPFGDVDGEYFWVLPTVGPELFIVCRFEGTSS